MTVQPQDNRKLWEQRYKEGKGRISYPYDEVVGFMLSRYSADRRNQTTVLDFGCGPGNHLWFLAESGFDAFGVDTSETAVELAKEVVARFGSDFDRDKIKVSGYDGLPFDDAQFDVVIDRSSLGQNRAEDIPGLVAEIRRVLKPGGTYFGINFSDHHPDVHRAHNYGDGDFAISDQGNLKDIGIRHFFGVAEIFDLFAAYDIEDIRVLDSRSLFNKGSNQQLLVVANK
jgi:SAM-dependent methyltransferase